MLCLSVFPPGALGLVRADAEPLTLNFDFGTKTSPVLQGYKGVNEELLYTPQLGYGLDVKVASRYRTGTTYDDMNADFILGLAYTFMVDIPNGEYDVTVYSGDILAGTSSTRTNVTIEGEAKGSISSRQAVTSATYRTVVSDGQMTLAFSGSGVGGYLNGLNIRQVVHVPPSSPAGLSVTGVTASDVTLQWNTVTDAVYYNLYRSPSRIDSYGKIATVTGTVYTDSSVTTGSSYGYKVSAVNAGGLESALSEAVTAEVNAPATPPAAPTQVAVTKVESQAVSLQWAASPGAAGYAVLRSGTQDGIYNEIGRTETALYTDTTADTSVPQYYQVRAYNDFGMSEPSNVAASSVYYAADPLPEGPAYKLDFGPGAVADGYIRVASTTAYSPELKYGFADPSKVGSVDRNTGDPLKSDFSVPADTYFMVDLPIGDYNIAIIAGDENAATDIAITAETIQKVNPTTKAAGEYLEMSFDIALVDGQLRLDFAGSAPKINAIVITKLPERQSGEMPTVYIAGDSTVQTYDEYWRPQAGWGQMIPRYFSSDVAFSNQSIGGRSSKSFIVQGRLDTILRAIKPGDYFLVQFGHNDATISVPERYASVPDYKNYLKTYVIGARQRGATPILVTPMGRRDFNADTGKFNVSFADYVAGMKEVAAELDVALVDLSALSVAYYDSIGPAATQAVFLYVEPGIYQAFPNGVQDNTHFQEYGAIQIARLLSGGIKNLGLPISASVLDIEPPSQVPAKPAGLTASSISNATAVLKWNAVEGAEIYRIYRKLSTDADYALIGTATVPTSSIGGMLDGKEYNVRVSAVNGRGESELSDELLIKTKEASMKYDFGLPTSPVAEGYTAVTTKTLYSPELGYGLTSLDGMAGRDRAIGNDLQRDFILRGGGFEFKVDLPNGIYSVKTIIGEMLSTGSARTAVVIEGKDYGIVSSGRGSTVEKVFNPIEVKDGQLNFNFGNSSASVNSIVNGLEITAILQAPSNLKLDGITLDPEHPSAQISWTPVEEAAVYRIYRQVEGAGSAELLGSVPEAAYIDTTADIGLDYTYTVSSVDNAGLESVMSLPLVVSMTDPSQPVPSVPINLTLTSIGKNEVTFAWDAVPEAGLYNIYRAKKAGGPFQLIGKSRETSFSDTSVLTTIPFYYKVAAVGLGGVSGQSESLVTEAVTVLKRQMEYIDRALVAVKSDAGVYVGWRMLGLDPDGIAFNIYRDGTKLNSQPITGSTNFVDTSGEAQSKYRLYKVYNGIEQPVSREVSVWQNNYLAVPLQKPADDLTKDGQPYTYSAGDASVGDLDGDGTYEIVMLWSPSISKDNSQAGYTGIVYMDAYKMDGTKLWRINLGRNIRAGAHYTQFMVYDLDGDGKAEVAFKTADGTVDGIGNVIGKADADHRNSSGYILQGPEYLTIFEGATGRALATTDYDPPRGDVAAWGDGYGNRVDRFLAGIAYLDGERPSLIMSRGYYTRTVLAAYNWRDGQLTKVWRFDTNDSGQSGYTGQGNHALNVGDVDGDGKDEINFGAMTIDDDGTGLYTTGLGHGDAQHFGDLDPTRPGLEVFGVHENTNSPYGLEVHDAETGEILWGVYTGKDTGRGMSADIDPQYPGEEVWSATITNEQHIPITGLYSIKGDLISQTIPSSTNFGIWWDGDLLRELLDSNRVDKWDYENQTTNNLFTAAGSTSNNGTKSTPAIQADLFGDWREEVMWKASDSSELRIYTTTAPTDYRIRTLMHDPNYRLSAAWQNVGYNQPPHPGFHLGAGMTAPAAPSIYYVNEPILPVSAIQVTAADNLTGITIGDTLQMHAAVQPEEANEQSVTWSVVSPDGTATNIATIDSGGLLHAVAAGDVKVVASANDGSGVKGEKTIRIISPVTVTNGRIIVETLPISGAEVAAITAQALEQAIKTVVDQTVTIQVVAGGQGDNVKVAVPAAPFRTTAGAMIDKLIVDTGQAIVSFSKESLEGKVGPNTEMLELTVSLVDGSAFPADVEQEIGGSKVYDIGLRIDGNDVNSLTVDKAVQVKIPYTLEQGEETSTIIVYRLDDTGMRTIRGARYDKQSGTIVFMTGSFGIFAAAIDKK
ncbi:Ig-like domain-containing protein [Paenibacillus sp. sptzw28]|nr:Ig-like domain-containing protein [Paenibacillus sp. sptzw28]